MTENNRDKNKDFIKEWDRANELMPTSFATIYGGEMRENVKGLCYGFFLAGKRSQVEEDIKSISKKLK